MTDREQTKTVSIGNRKIGGGNPILIQSMCNTKTEDVAATVAQILALEAAGCDIIRVAVPTMEAAEALKEIDKSLEEKQNENISVELLKNKRMYSIYETDLKEKNTVNLFDSKDCISGEFVFLYPPGIPLVVPGEVITEELLEQIKVYLEANMNISGLKDNSNKTIEVVK